MVFKVEITMENGDKYSFVAKNMMGVGVRGVTICDIQDLGALEEWEDRNKNPGPLPILSNPDVRFTPNKR